MVNPVPNGVTESREERHGSLYVVSTPIGNLEDITLRALRILKSAHIIAAENTAHTKGLCERYGIKTRLVSYHQHNQHTRTPELINQLTSGFSIALVTDAGTPGISDPGAYLINRVIERNLTITPIPGPSAAVAALSVSGLPTSRFVFLGFLPSKGGKRRKELTRLASESRTMVFFEAPHRLKAMLTDLSEIFGDRKIAVVRELTKAFEEIRRGSVYTILESWTPEKIRGEFTLVVAGAQKEKDVSELSQEIGSKIDRLLEGKAMSTKDIAREISSEEGLGYRQVYKECLFRKRILDGCEKDGSDTEA